MRPAWPTERVPGQAPKLHRETLSRKMRKSKTKIKQKTETAKQIKRQLSMGLAYRLYSSSRAARAGAQGRSCTEAEPGGETAGWLAHFAFPYKPGPTS